MNKKILSLILILTLTITTFAGCGGEKADTVITGKIYTSNENAPIIQAAAIKNGVYVYVGNEEGAKAYIGDQTKIIKTNDGIAMPSFMDGHAHGVEGGVGYLYEANLYEGTSVEDYQKTLKDFIEEHPDLDFIRGAGWINGYLPPGGGTTEMLDEVSKEIPIAIVSADHHSYWINSKAMEIMKIDENTEDVKGGIIERNINGMPAGTFRENAQYMVKNKIPEYSVEQYKNGILTYQEEAKSFGITAYFEPMINLDGHFNILKAYNELDEEGLLKIRVFGGYQISPESNPIAALDKVKEAMEKAKGGDFEISGIKILVDGVVEGGTAYLLEDYANKPGYRGEPLWEQKELNDFCTKANEMGLTIHTHAIGDAAVKMIVDAYEVAQKKSTNKDIRNAITHLQLVEPSDIERMADLKIMASTNPYWFCKEPGYFEELEVPFLGLDRANKEYPMKSFFDAGVTVAAASDFPVTMPANPLLAIQTGITRCARDGNLQTLQNPDQRVTVGQMMNSTTINPAYQVFGEDVFGSVEVGKSADIIILDQDITKINAFDIGKTKVLKVIFKGNIS